MMKFILTRFIATKIIFLNIFWSILPGIWNTWAKNRHFCLWQWIWCICYNWIQSTFCF